jgi:hypothetical protein
MKIASALLAVLLACLSVAAVRQARRAWRDPDWEPGSTAQSPRSVVAMAILLISFAVFFAGGSVLADAAGVAGKDAGRGLVAVGFLGVIFAVVTIEATRRFGRPRFLIPPPMRPGYGRTVPLGPAGPTIADIQGAAAAQARETARGTLRASGAANRAGAPADSPPPRFDDEFILIAGPGSHQTGAVSDVGRLVLTTRRLILSTRRANLLGQSRSWPVADLQVIAAAPGGTEMTLRFTDGHEEVFTVEKHRGLWLSKVNKLLSLPRPITSWYGDPADKDRPVAVPDGAAVVVLWRANGEQRDRQLAYRVLLDGRKAAKIKRGKRIELPTSPGRHVIGLRSIWVGSRPIPFEAQAGQVLRFCCEPGGFPGMTQADMERDVTGYIRLRLL